MNLRHLAVEADGTCRYVRLSGRPLSHAEALELDHVCDELRESAEPIRVVVVGSRGEDFCPGPAEDLDPLRCGVDPAASLASLDCPVIAALHGRVASVGVELALAADIRVIAPDTRLSLSDVAAGRLPSWGGTQRLPRLAGRGVAAMMILAGHELDATEARRCGLAQVAGGEQEALDLAARLADLAPLALSAAKEALRRGPELPMRHALELEGDLNHLLQTTDDRAEGLRAFFEKRPPRFEGS